MLGLVKGLVGGKVLKSRNRKKLFKEDHGHVSRPISPAGLTNDPGDLNSSGLCLSHAACMSSYDCFYYSIHCHWSNNI